MKTFTESTEICTAYGILMAAIAAVIVNMLTGCSGIEVGGKVGVYRVDQHQETTSFRGASLPLKCYLWEDCTAIAPQQPQGS